MNLGINPSMNNYSSMNCKRNNAPSFGMAVFVHESAEKVMKDQVLKMSPKKAEQFWDKLHGLIERQKENPVNTIIRKCKRRNALAAEVVDSNAENAVKNSTYSQGLLSSNGSLKFAEKAEKQADKLNQANAKIAELPKAEEAHFYAGGEMPEA